MKDENDVKLNQQLSKLKNEIVAEKDRLTEEFKDNIFYGIDCVKDTISLFEKFFHFIFLLEQKIWNLQKIEEEPEEEPEEEKQIDDDWFFKKTQTQRIEEEPETKEELPLLDWQNFLSKKIQECSEKEMQSFYQERFVYNLFKKEGLKMPDWDTVELFIIQQIQGGQKNEISKN